MESPEVPLENGHGDRMSLTHSNSPHSDPGTHEQESNNGSTISPLPAENGQMEEQPMDYSKKDGSNKAKRISVLGKNEYQIGSKLLLNL